jgi:DNA-binding NtrC family response regulator
MARPTETIDESGSCQTEDSEGAVPGVVVVFSKGEPLQAPLRLENGEITLGRRSMPGIQLSDHRMSRSHVRVSRTSGGWRVEDLGSRNGTAVDGERLDAPLEGATLGVVRAGDTLFALRDDIRPFEDHPLDLGEPWVLGPKMRAVLDAIRRSAAFGSLHITGETGTGKELAARSFHTFGPTPNGPFVAVNCATIPEGVADRLLFGARKGAFSGATADVGGYVQEADGGTLFLDEVGELDAAVQAKLLRFLETREVVPLGDSRAKKVDVRVCSATHHDLRKVVRAGKFREDLLYRIARPHVSLPPLRERLEDVPHLIDRKLRSIDERLIAHVSLVEACLLRPWPGNVRELSMELQESATAALLDGEVVRESHLGRTAGMRGTGSSVKPKIPAAAAEEPVREADLDRALVIDALKRCDGRVATAARELGVHRNQLRRWLEKNKVDPKTPA